MEQFQPAAVDSEAAVLPTSEAAQPKNSNDNADNDAENPHIQCSPLITTAIRGNRAKRRFRFHPGFRDWLSERWENIPGPSLSHPRKGTIGEEEITKVEFVYRYSILSCRLRVLQHGVMEKAQAKESTIGVDIPEEVQRDLSQYTQALRDHTSPRTEGQDLFNTDKGLDSIFTSQLLIAEAEAARRRDGSTPSLEDWINHLWERITNDFRKTLLETTSGMSKARQARERRTLWARLSMAIGGGLALVVPMIVMVLHPTKLTAMLTTSLFVVAVAVFLAVLMNDSQPKDVVACTVAYAAVLAVFVGAGGGGLKKYWWAFLAGKGTSVIADVL